MKLIVLLAALLALPCCESAQSATSSPQDSATAALSTEDTLSYLRQRLVGWTEYEDYYCRDGDDLGRWTTYEQVELNGCALVLTQRIACGAKRTWTEQIVFPLDQVAHIQWSPHESMPDGSIVLTVKDQKQLIGTKRVKGTTTYMSSGAIAVPGAAGNGVANALRHLQAICVHLPNLDPFNR